MANYSGTVTLSVQIPVYDIEANTPEEADILAQELAADLLSDEVDSIDGGDIEVLESDIYESDEEPLEN